MMSNGVSSQYADIILRFIRATNEDCTMFEKFGWSHFEYIFEKEWSEATQSSGFLEIPEHTKTPEHTNNQ